MGKAARVAYVVPAARPFVSGLWGGLGAARQLARLSAWQRTNVPCRRLCYSASWMRALLSEAEDCPLRLERLVSPTLVVPRFDDMTIEFDASIYGGGGVLRAATGTVVEFFSVVWQGDEAPHLGVEPWVTAHQTFWEFATLLLALCVWGDSFTQRRVSVLGDNTGALNNALSFRGKGPLEALSRELSWRQARRGWLFDVGHLPSEYNVVADALSRITDPKGTGWPSEALAAAAEVSPPRLRDLWIAKPR